MGRAPKTTVLENDTGQEAATEGGFETQQSRAVAPATRSRAPAKAAAVTGMTPMDMVAYAVQNAQGVDVIEKLMGLQERHERNLARKNFDAAMSMAQNELPVIFKNREVDFTSQKGRTRYNYEDLAEITKAVRPVLANHGLSFRFRTEQGDAGQVTVFCRIAHADGYFEENSLTAALDTSGNKNHIQSIASTVTFLERYTLKAALGLASSDDAEDDDGNGGGEQSRVPSASIQQQKATQQQDQREQVHSQPSGQIKPYPIKTDTAENWTALYVKGINTAASVAVIEEWDAINDATLKRIESAYPDLMEQINEAVKLRKLAIVRGQKTSAQPKDDPISSGPIQAPAEKREPKQANNYPVLPDPNDETKYEDFVVQATAALDGWKDADTLHAFFNEMIDSAALLQPDREDLQGALRRAEKRLEQ